MKLKSLFSLAMLAVFFTISIGFVTPSNNTPQMEFADFLSHFEHSELPFEISLDYMNIQHCEQKETIDSEKKKQHFSNIQHSEYIPELAFGIFSRSGPPIIEPVARFYPNTKSVAVVYTSKHRFGAGYTNYQMLIFDLKGNMLFPNNEKGNKIAYSSFPLGLNSYRKKISCIIDKAGNIFQNTYTVKWKKELHKVAMEENEIDHFVLEESKVFNIKSNGTIEEIEWLPTKI